MMIRSAPCPLCWGAKHLLSTDVSQPCFRCHEEGFVADATQSEWWDAARRLISFFGGEFDLEDRHVNLLGLRGWSKEVGPNENSRDEYNDTIIAAWRDGESKFCEMFRASVDPGQFEGGHSEGDAHLIPGQYWFRVGRHPLSRPGGYPALNQDEPVRVWRDRDKDGKRIGMKEAEVHSGFFGINIHAAGEGDRVGRWSAGCQVVHGGVGGAPWLRFMEIASSDPRRRMRYMLIDRSLRT